MPAEGQRFGHQAAPIRFWLRADESATSIYHALADGDIVVVEARGNNLTRQAFGTTTNIAWCSGWRTGRSGKSGKSGNIAIQC
jgi:hypothetical protein